MDFFEVPVEVGGQQKAWKFLMRLMCPESDFAWLYSSWLIEREIIGDINGDLRKDILLVLLENDQTRDKER